MIHLIEKELLNFTREVLTFTIQVCTKENPVFMESYQT